MSMDHTEKFDYGQTVQGAQPKQQALEATLAAAEPVAQYPFAKVTLGMARVRPTLDFVLPGLLVKTVGMIVGQGAVGKSMLALQIGIAVASGTQVAGGIWPAGPAGKVTLIFGEDPPEIIQERLYWLKEAEGIGVTKSAQIDENIVILSAAGHDLRLLQKMNGSLLKGPFLDDFEKLCEGQRLVIVDPLAFLTDADENDNGAMTRLMQTLSRAGRKTDATIIVLHHVSKGSASQSNDKEDWAAARGASSLTTGCRWQVNMRPPNKDEMAEFKISPDLRGSWVMVAQTKTNHGQPTPASTVKRGKGGTLRAKDPLDVSVTGGTAHAAQTRERPSHRANQAKASHQHESANGRPAMPSF